jgi:hypothetical protein
MISVIVPVLNESPAVASVVHFARRFPGVAEVIAAVSAAGFRLSGPLLAAVSPAHTISAFAVIAASSVVIIGLLYHVERRTRFLKPDAIAAIIIIVVALTMIYLRRLGPSDFNGQYSFPYSQ